MTVRKMTLALILAMEVVVLGFGFEMRVALQVRLRIVGG